MHNLTGENGISVKKGDLVRHYRTADGKKGKTHIVIQDTDDIGPNTSIPTETLIFGGKLKSTTPLKDLLWLVVSDSTEVKRMGKKEWSLLLSTHHNK